MDNQISSWMQGKFYDSGQYCTVASATRERWEREEKVKVRPSPKGNSICMAKDPQAAIWIAKRLNLASRLEQMTYDYATGKTDGSEIVSFVNSNVQ